MLVRILLLAVAFLAFNAPAQTGPGGVGNTSGSSTLRIWVDAGKGVIQSSASVSQWSDLSGYGNHLVMATAANQPSFATNVFNGLPAVRYTGASQYFNSAFSGPNSSGISIFLFTKGSSYQSIVRYQNQGGVFLVYPWEVGGGRTFITSSDGGTGGGINSGFVSNVKNIGTARYNMNTTTTGFQTFLNGGLVAQKSSANATLPNEPFFSGRYNPGASEYPTADVSELIIFYSAVNEAQRIIVENYLAAKYDTLLTANDLYTMDNSANGNYDYDMAGIGQASDGSNQTNSRGTGVVQISNPSTLANSKFFMWGKNNAALGTTTTANMPSAAPQSVQTRWAAEWRVSESGGDVGTLSISFDLTGFTPATASDLRLIIDTDNDGLFSDEVNGTGVIAGANALGGNVYEFTGVNIADGSRFTLGSVNAVATTLPITLINFAADIINQQVLLKWETSAEENNSRFELSRSANAQNWQLIATVKGHNNSLVQNSYSFLDVQANKDINYYRLTDISDNGQRHDSKIIAVNVSDHLSSVTIYPNPSSGKIFVASDEPVVSFSAYLCDLSGKKYALSFTQPGKNLLEIETDTFSTGIYQLNYTLNGESPKNIKISIENRE